MTSNARPGTRILGSLQSADGMGVVRIEDRYDTGVDDLWSALTDPGRLTWPPASASWYGSNIGYLSSTIFSSRGEPGAVVVPGGQGATA